jgi:hypothetical protein
MNRREFLQNAAWTSALSAIPAVDFAQNVSAVSERPVRTVWDHPQFAVRGLEIHSRRMWEWRSIASTFALMEKLNLNTLILHWDNLQDAIVWPDAYIPMNVRIDREPIQGSHERDVFLLSAREYLSNVSRETKRRGLKFFFEVTEIEFADALIALHPEILGPKGTPCPTNPFWWDFIKTKYTELFEVLPNLNGVIVSPGTHESKLSIALKRCDCASCNIDPVDWYVKLIGAMFEPIKQRGKILAVRDFAYNKENQNLVMEACTRVSKEIVAALKNKPHDFYLTFPDNPKIGHVDGRPQWIEFDCWGQFYGCGLFPCSVVEDMQLQLQHALEKGATGVWFRTDLESMTDESVFNSFNLLNLVAGGMLSQEPKQDIDEVYRAWLQTGLYDSLLPESMQPPAVPIPEQYLAQLKSFMQATHSVVEKAFYIRGFLFYRDGRMPDTIENALFNMIVHAGREDWDPGSNKLLDFTEENLEAIIAEKDAALAEVEKLPEILKPASLPVSDAFRKHIDMMLALFRENVRGFRLIAIGIFRAKLATTTKSPDQARQALQVAEELEAYKAAMVAMLAGKYFPQSVYRSFHLERVDSMAKDIRTMCSSLA